MEHPRANRSAAIVTGLPAIDTQHRQFRRMLRQLPDESRSLTVDAAYVEFVKAQPKRSVA